MIFEYLDHSNLVIALEVDLAEIIFVKKVIGNHQPLVVVGESDGVRSGIQPEIHDASLKRRFRVADIKHAHLPCLERREEQAIASFRHRQKLDHASTDRDFDVGDDVLAVEYRDRRSVDGVHQVNESIEHTGGKCAAQGVTGNQFDVHGADGIGKLDGADYPALLEIPYTDCAAQQRVAGNDVQRTRRHHEVRGHHQVEFGARRDAVGIEAVLRRMNRPLPYPLQVFVELGNATWLSSCG